MQQTSAFQAAINNNLQTGGFDNLINLQVQWMLKFIGH